MKRKREVRCYLRERDNTIPVYPEKDWANPGCQHKNQFGPKPMVMVNP